MHFVGNFSNAVPALEENRKEPVSFGHQMEVTQKSGISYYTAPRCIFIIH